MDLDESHTSCPACGSEVHPAQKEDAVALIADAAKAVEYIDADELEEYAMRRGYN